MDLIIYLIFELSLKFYYNLQYLFYTNLLSTIQFLILGKEVKLLHL